MKALSKRSCVAVRGLFSLLANENVLRILLALGEEDLTLPELRRRLGRSKPLLCTYLTKLWKQGLLSKKFTDGSLRYHLEKRSVLGLVVTAESLLESTRKG